MKLIKGKIYLVLWIDTFQSIGWKDIEEINEICKKNKEWIKTIGFYLGTFHGYEVFASQFTDNVSMLPWSGITSIPKGTIKKIERLDK